MFRPLSSLAIRTKILISSILTLSLISGFIFTYYPAQQEQQIFEAMERHDKSMAEMIAFGVAFGMGSGNFSAVTQALDWAKNEGDLVFAVVLDEDNEIFAAYNPDALTLKMSVLLGDEDRRLIDGRWLHLVQTSVRYKNTNFGTIVIGSSLEPMNQSISENIRTALMVCLAILVFGIGSSYFFGHIITKPLKELRDAALQIGEGNYDVEVPVSGSDEVGMAASVLKDMVGNILKTLRESEEKFRSMCYSAQDAIIMMDDGGEITFWNKAAQEIMGYSAEEALGKNLHDLIAPERFRADARVGVSTFRSTGEGSLFSRVVSVTAIRKNGTEFPVEMSLSKFKLTDRWHAVGIIRDVSKLKRAESQLRLLGMVINQASEVVITTDTKGYITYVNPAFENISGYSREEVLGKSPEMFTSDQRGKEFYRELWKDVSNGNIWKGTLESKKKDGTPYTEEATISPVYSDEGKLVSYVAVKRDVTLERQLEIRREELQEKLERAKRMESLGILAGGVAHDLNNILSPIVGYSELILMDTDEDDLVHKQVGIINKSAQDAADVIQDLLTLARRGRYQMKPININDVVKSYLESPGYQKCVKTHSETRVSVNLDDSLPHITGSAPHLLKVIMNLIVNAFDAMEIGGELTIKTLQHEILVPRPGLTRIEPGKYVVLSVRDTGTGIAPEDIKKIFEPYFSKKKMDASGTGLGLSVVYGVVKDHKAFHDVVSKLGEGTEFLLYFPVAESGIEIKAEPKINIRGSETILIVDDDAKQRDMAALLLGRLGYHTATAEDGHDAMHYLDEHTVDLVLLDMIIDNDFDGLAIYKEMVKKHPGQRALIVSGFAATEGVIKMQQLGAGEYIRKPYTLDALGKAIRKELDQTPVAAT